MDLDKLFIELALYPAMEMLKGNRTRRYIRELNASVRFTPGELENLRREGLKALLLHCVEHVPAYKAFTALKPEIEKNPFAALEKIPALTKADFRNNPDAYFADNADRSSLIENRTGGSTGQPVVFHIDRFTVEHYEAARWRGLSWWGISRGSRSVMIWGHPVELAKAEQKSFAMKEKYFKNRTVISAYSLYEKDMSAHVAHINERKPEYIYGFATALYTFASMMERMGMKLNFKMKGVLSTSETLHEHYIPVIEKAFGCGTINEYGARDGGIIAMQAPCGNMHISAENEVVEILDLKTHKPLPHGETGMVAITDLHNYSQPRLRYLLSDMASLSDKPCGCGIGLPVMGRIAGREDDMFVTPDGRMFYPDIFNRFAKLYAPDAISAFQAIQKSPLLTDMKIVLMPDAPGEQLARFLAEAKNMLPGANMNVEYVDSIPKTSSGKTRYAIREFELFGRQ